MPYQMLSAPFSEGGVNCPSLIQWKIAYDLKFIGDLISRPQDVPWKVWTHADIHRASLPHSVDITPLNLFLQQACITFSKLEPRVCHALKAPSKSRLNVQIHLPSPQA